jgi:hypothetical protein
LKTAIVSGGLAIPDGFNIVNVKLFSERNKSDNIVFDKYVKFCLINVSPLTIYEKELTDVDTSKSAMFYFVLTDKLKPFTVYINYSETLTNRNLLDSFIVY